MQFNDFVIRQFIDLLFILLFFFLFAQDKNKLQMKSDKQKNSSCCKMSLLNRNTFLFHGKS